MIESKQHGYYLIPSYNHEMWNIFHYKYIFKTKVIDDVYE